MQAGKIRRFFVVGGCDAPGKGGEYYREVVQASRAIRQLNDELLLTLSKIIAARDPYVAGHTDKVTDYAITLAKELGLPAERVERVRQAALLHDVGKIGISEQVLHKPGALTDREYEHIKSHVTLGAEFLDTCQGLRCLIPFVRHHHEWWDGSGYPEGLKGEQIPMESRVLAIADSFEAMSSARPYRPALSREEVMEELRKGAGTPFDPKLVEVFIGIIEAGLPEKVRTGKTSQPSESIND